MNSGIDPNRPVRYGASFSSNAALAANTPENVLAAASNVNGVIVWGASFSSYQSVGSTPFTSLLAKATAPATVNDGDVLCAVDTHDYQSAVTLWSGGGRLSRPIFVPAGKRLDWISTNMVAGHRRLLYTVL